MTVGELIATLSAFDASQPVVAQWEGVLRDLSVYAAPEGTVVLDADDDFYRAAIERGEWDETFAARRALMDGKG